jgi:hypothetical protein
MAAACSLSSSAGSGAATPCKRQQHTGWTGQDGLWLLGRTPSSGAPATPLPQPSAGQVRAGTHAAGSFGLGRAAVTLRAAVCMPSTVATGGCTASRALWMASSRVWQTAACGAEGRLCVRCQGAEKAGLGERPAGRQGEQAYDTWWGRGRAGAARQQGGRQGRGQWRHVGEVRRGRQKCRLGGGGDGGGHQQQQQQQLAAAAADCCGVAELLSSL